MPLPAMSGAEPWIGSYRPRGQPWTFNSAPMLALGIAVATALVFVAFLWHVLTGGAWEARTMGAMILRTGIWTAIAALALRGKKPT